MSDHSFIPKANPKIVPPAIPAPRKESLEQENARLKAEVERLRNLGIKLESKIDPLLAQIERLTKAGDNLVYVVTEHPVAEPFVKAWFAAKEGKPRA